jgi:hypothetical protein
MGDLERGPSLGKKRLSKPSSAENILRTVLRELGYTSKYKKGQLSGPQHLEIVDAIRSFARAWLRHEAEQFAQNYLGDDRGFQGGSEGQQVGRSLHQQVNRLRMRIRNFIRESIVAGAMALLGPRPLTGAELDQAERLAQMQEQFLGAFMDKVAQAPPAFRPDKTTEIIAIAPPMTMDQFIARAESYGSVVWGASQEIARATIKNNRIFDQERRWMAVAEHCQSCPEAAAMGWQPIGTLPPIGDSECMNNCKCSFSYRLGDDGVEHIAGRGPMYDEALGDM